MIAIVADLLSTNRKLLEDVRFAVKQMQTDLDPAAPTKQTQANRGHVATVEKETTRAFGVVQ